MLIYILSIVFSIMSISFITGGSICLFVNHDTSRGCYYVFGIGISLLLCVVSMGIFFLIMECINCSKPQSSFVPSGPLGPLGMRMYGRHERPGRIGRLERLERFGSPERLSSSPSSPSKILVSRKKP